MTTVFISEPWEEIREALLSPKRRPAYCAIGYLGPTADQVMPLRQGDVLVCDASDWAVRRGATSTHALERFVKAGVDVYTCACLHAKIVVLARRAYVGSMNASRNSQDTLIEAAMLTTQTAAVQQARQFVLDNAQRHVDMDEVRRLRKLEPKKPAFIHSRRKGVPSRMPKGLDEVLLLPTTKHEWSPEAERLQMKSVGTARAESRVLGTRARLTAVEYPGKTRLREHTWVIQVMEEQGIASGPEYVVHIETSQKTRLVWLSRPSDVKANRPLADLQAALKGQTLTWGSLDECQLQGSPARAAIDLFRLQPPAAPHPLR